MSNEILEELNASFVVGEREFKGEPLAPYTEGSRLLLMQIRDEEDSSIYFVWSFIFIHILLKKDRKIAINLAWNKVNFKEKLFEWICDKTEIDRNIATNLVSSIIEEANKAKVEVISFSGGSPPNA